MNKKDRFDEIIEKGMKQFDRALDFFDEVVLPKNPPNTTLTQTSYNITLTPILLAKLVAGEDLEFDAKGTIITIRPSK